MRFPAYSHAGAYLGDIPEVLSAVRTRNVDGTDRLELKCTGIGLQKDDRVLVRCHDAWREFAVVSVSRERASSTGALTAVCRNSVSELSRTYVLEREGRGYTASRALDKALEGTRWERGDVDAPGTANVSFYHQSALESIEDICAAYGCELDATVEVEGGAVSRRLVHLRAHVGGQAARRRFEYGRDLVSVRRTVSADDVVTRLYPWGRGVETEGGGYSRKIGIADVNGGVPYIEDVEATRRFGIPDAQGVPQPAEGSWEDGSIDDPAELLAKARRVLAERSTPTVSYEAEVAVVARAGEGIEGAACGDAVQIVDAAFEPPLRLEGRVLETVEDLAGDLSRSRITLGNVVEGITGRSRRVEAAVQRLTGSAGAWDAAAGLGEGYLNGVIDGLNAVLNEAGGYTYLKPGQGIFVYDRPEDGNPTQCIQIGGGFLRIADRRRADGTWDFRTIGNGRGLVADSLYTGTIRGGANSWNLSTGDLLFRQGAIRDAKGLTSWNLSTGDFRARGIVATDADVTGRIVSGSGRIGGFDIGASTISNGAMSLRGDGMWLRRDGVDMGKIGTNRLTSDASKRGLSLDLEHGGDYMTLAAKEGASASEYTMFLTYAAKPLPMQDGSAWAARTLHVASESDFHRFVMRNAYIDPNTGGANGGITGTIDFVQVLAMNGDGTVARWGDGARMVFKNGMLVDMTSYRR